MIHGLNRQCGQEGSVGPEYHPAPVCGSPCVIPAFTAHLGKTVLIWVDGEEMRQLSENESRRIGSVEIQYEVGRSSTLTQHKLAI